LETALIERSVIWSARGMPPLWLRVGAVSVNGHGLPVGVLFGGRFDAAVVNGHELVIRSAPAAKAVTCHRISE
jgi:hypothetical protein